MGRPISAALQATHPGSIANERYIGFAEESCTDSIETTVIKRNDGLCARFDHFVLGTSLFGDQIGTNLGERSRSTGNSQIKNSMRSWLATLLFVTILFLVSLLIWYLVWNKGRKNYHIFDSNEKLSVLMNL